MASPSSTASRAGSSAPCSSSPTAPSPPHSSCTRIRQASLALPPSLPRIPTTADEASLLARSLVPATYTYHRLPSVFYRVPSSCAPLWTLCPLRARVRKTHEPAAGVSSASMLRAHRGVSRARVQPFLAVLLLLLTYTPILGGVSRSQERKVRPRTSTSDHTRGTCSSQSSFSAQ